MAQLNKQLSHKDIQDNQLKRFATILHMSSKEDHRGPVIKLIEHFANSAQSLFIDNHCLNLLLEYEGENMRIAFILQECFKILKPKAPKCF